MAETILDRAEKHTTYDLGGARRRSVITIHDQWVRDAGQWAAADERLVLHGIDGFARKIAMARHAALFAENGTRRWCPDKDRPGEYLEFGRPQFWTGADWATVNIGLPTLPTPNTYLWDRTNYSIRFAANWRGVKLEIALKNSNVSNRVRLPVSLVGLGWNAGRLIRDGVTVARVMKPFAWDRYGADVPVVWSIGGGYLEFSVPAGLAADRFPITIDPTVTLPSGDRSGGKDTWVVSAVASARNYGVAQSANLTIDASKMLLEFDCSGIEGTIEAGDAAPVLTIYAAGTSAGNIGVHEINDNNAAWTEGDNNGTTADAGESCWDYLAYNTVGWAGSAGLATAGAAKDTAASDYVTTAIGTLVDTGSLGVGDPMACDLTKAAVATWFGASNANNGILLRRTSGNGRAVYASDAAEAVRPSLVVVYTEAASGTAYTRTITDALGITDARFWSLGIARTVAETAGVTDAAIPAATLPRLVADSVGMTDAAAQLLTFGRTVADAVGVTDALTRLPAYARTFADSVGVTDAISRAGTFARTLTDAVGIADTVRRALNPGAVRAVWRWIGTKISLGI